jgi:hypothetical protein
MKKAIAKQGTLEIPFMRQEAIGILMSNPMAITRVIFLCCFQTTGLQ